MQGVLMTNAGSTGQKHGANRTHPEGQEQRVASERQTPSLQIGLRQSLSLSLSLSLSPLLPSSLLLCVSFFVSPSLAVGQGSRARLFL